MLRGNAFRTATILMAALLAAWPTAHAAAPDYRELDAVLVRNVRNGFIDYDGIRADPAFSRFVVALGTASPADLESREDRLAFLLNAYNALAIQSVLAEGPTASPRKRQKAFGRTAHRVLGRETTLKDLAEEELAASGDPRVHLAMVCASLACPRLPNRAYLPSRLDSQLEAATREFVNDGSRNRFDPTRRLAFVSRIFQRHQDDFVARAGSVQRFLAAYAADPQVAELLRQDAFRLEFVPDDDGLNGIFRGTGARAARD